MRSVTRANLFAFYASLITGLALLALGFAAVSTAVAGTPQLQPNRLTAAPLADNCFVSANNSGATDYSSVDGSALQTAVNTEAAGSTLKVAGNCAGVQTQGGETQTLYINKNITIIGGYDAGNWGVLPNPAAYETILDAQGNGRVVYITNNTAVTLSYLTLRNGDAGASFGGGIYADTNTALTFAYSRIENSQAFAGGAMTPNAASVTIHNSVLIGNSAHGGGGVYALTASSLTMTHSSLIGNQATSSEGGGLYNDNSSVFIENSTIHGNQATNAGAIQGAGGSQTTIRYSTISQNSASSGVGGVESGSGMTLLASIVAANTGGDCAGSSLPTDLGYNLIADGGCLSAGSSLSGTADLGSLANHGGLPTSNGSAPETAALLFSSAARNAIPYLTADCGNGLEIDQRNSYRLYGNTCDIGAYEYTNTPPIAVNDTYTTNEDISLTVAVSGVLANDSDVDADTLYLTEITPQSGTVSTAVDGSFVYIPSADYNGTLSATYTLADGGLPTVGYWNFDQGAGNSVRDESGYQHTAIVSGTAAYTAISPGPDVNFANPYAYDYQTGGGVLKIADSHLLNLSAHNERTVSFWIRPTNFLLDSRKQVIWEEGGRTNGLNLYIYDGSLYAGAWSENNNWAGEWLSTTVGNNSWHHIALVLDSSSTDGATADSLFLYHNGNLVTSGTAAQLSSHIGDIGVGDVIEDTRFHDGEVSGDGGHNYAGRIDDLRVMNIAANASEIDVLRQNQPGGSATGEITFVINAVNDAPRPSDNNYTTVEDSPISGNLLSDDTGAGVDLDLESDSFELVQVSDSPHGIASFTADGNFIFTPTLNFAGVTSFPYRIAQGAIDYALQFDGDNDSLQTESVSNGNEVTVEAWVRPDTPAGDHQYIYNGNGTPHIILEIYNGRWRGRVWTESSNSGYIEGPYAAAGQWTHLAYVYNYTNNHAQLYINGVSAGTATALQPVAHSSQRRIGTNSSATSNFFEGQIDELRLWNKAHTTIEVQALMLDSFITSQPDLLAYYRFNDGPGSGTAVSVAPSSNGTLVNIDPVNAWQAWPIYSPNVSAEATVTITVTGVADPIVAVPDSYDGASNRILTVAAPGVLANEIEVDGDPLQASLITSPAHGVLAMTADGGFVYTPTADYLGQDTFLYEISNGGFTDTAVVTLTLYSPIVDLSQSCGDVTALINGMNTVAATPYIDTIELAPNCTYTLTNTHTADHEGVGAIGFPPITDTLIIQGQGSTLVRDGTADPFRFFSVAPTGHLSLQRLTLENGYAQGGDGARYNNSAGAGGGAAGLGGAIFNRGTLTIEQSTLLNNRAVGGSGGSSSTGDSSGNPGGGGGGLGGDAIDNLGGGLNGGSGAGGFGGGGSGGNNGNLGGFGGGGGGSGTNNGNHGGFAGGGGGGSGQFQQIGTGGNGGFAGGQGGTGKSFGGQGGAGGGGAALGGAIFNYGGSVTIENSTLVSNTTQAGVIGLGRSDGSTTAQAYGGALFNHSGSVTLHYSTLAANTGGGVYNYQTGTAVLQGVIVADSVSGTDCVNNGGTITVNQSLIESDSSCDTPTITADPQLGTLQFRTDYAPTLPLGHSSPAIDVIALGTAGCGSPFMVDQWGVTRPQETGCDLGAYEWIDAEDAVTPTVSVMLTPPSTLTFSWLADAANCSLDLFSSTAPYSGFAILVAGEMGTSYDVASTAGNPAMNTFYYVQANGCSNGSTAVSPTFGEFDFALEPGS